jgi:ABC-type Fe3+-hydroxamate transport system substrate-binding protein
MRVYSIVLSRLTSFFLFLCLMFLAACSQNSTPSTGQSSNTPTATPTSAVDAYGTPISFPQSAPQRIVSLEPNISEILGALNLQNHVAAVDYNTNYPAELARLPKISDINGNLNVERIVALHPDLILSSGGITRKYDAQLTQLNLHVVDLPSFNFDQSLQQILLVGRLTFTQDTATALVKQLQQQVAQIKSVVAGTTAPKVLLEVDDSTPGKPYVFGGGSFGDEMLQYANAINIFHSDTSNGGYPQVTDEAVISANPQFVVLTEDPAYGGDPNAVYKRANWGNIDAVKTHHVYHINSDIMQRPGPRLVEGLRCIAQVVHSEKFSGPLPSYCTASV